MSSSEDEYCSNTVKKFQCMKDKWVPDIKPQPVSNDLDHTFDDSAVTIVEPKSEEKPKEKMKKGKRVSKATAKSVAKITDRCVTSKATAKSVEKITDPSVTSNTDQENVQRMTRSTSRVPSIPEYLTELITTYFSGAAAVPQITPRNLRGRGARRRTSTGGRRRTPNRGRRSRGRASYANNYINLGCDSDDGDNRQPLFSSPHSAKPVMLNDSVADLEHGGSFSETLDSTLEMDNEELSVKVHWRSKDYLKFKIRKHQKLTSVFEHLAELVCEPIDHILLTLGDRLLRPQDTPALIQYNICQFIEGGVVPHSVTNIAQESALKYGVTDIATTVDPNQLKIKIQTKTMKSPIEVAIGKDQKMSVAMVKFSEEMEIPLAKLKFYFDGDIVDENSTPESLDMEGGECIDVIVHT